MSKRVGSRWDLPLVLTFRTLPDGTTMWGRFMAWVYSGDEPLRWWERIWVLWADRRFEVVFVAIYWGFVSLPIWGFSTYHTRRYWWLRWNRPGRGHHNVTLWSSAGWRFAEDWWGERFAVIRWWCRLGYKPHA